MSDSGYSSDEEQLEYDRQMELLRRQRQLEGDIRYYRRCIQEGQDYISYNKNDYRCQYQINRYLDMIRNWENNIRRLEDELLNLH